MSGLSEEGRLSRISSSGSLDSMNDSGGAVAERHSRSEETGWQGLHIPPETTKVFVNNEDNPKSNTPLENVHNRESSMMEAQVKFVNNNIEGPKMENHFEDESDEFD